MQVPVDEADFLPAHNDRGQKSSATTDVFEDTKRENPDPFFRGVSVTDLSSALRTPYTEANDSTSFLQQFGRRQLQNTVEPRASVHPKSCGFWSLRQLHISMSKA